MQTIRHYYALYRLYRGCMGRRAALRELLRPLPF